jgi:glycosyltransferase involved in cell wall biosynthesis
MDITVHSMGLRGMSTHKSRIREVDKRGRAKHAYTAMPGTLHSLLFDTFDVLVPRHCHAQIVHSFGARRIKTTDSRLIVSIQDVIPIRLNEGPPSYVRQSQLELGYLTERAAAVITISEFSRREIAEVLDVDPERIHVIANGVDRSRYYPIEEHEITGARQLLLEHDVQAPYIVHFGGAAERKNVDRLIRSFALLKKTTKLPHQLVIAGQIPSQHLCDEIARSGVADAIKCVGYLDGSVATLLLKLADLLVFPSTYEGFGLPPLEAMACAVPVALSTAASLPEVGGDACVYFDPYSIEEMTDAMVTLLTDSGLRQSCIDLGLAQSEKFCWKKNALSTLALYEQVLNGCPERPAKRALVKL